MATEDFVKAVSLAVDWLAPHNTTSKPADAETITTTAEAFRNYINEDAVRLSALEFAISSQGSANPNAEAISVEELLDVAADLAQYIND